MDERKRNQGKGKKKEARTEEEERKEGKKDVGFDVESAYSSQTKTRSGPMNLT